MKEKPTFTVNGRIAINPDYATLIKKYLDKLPFGELKTLPQIAKELKLRSIGGSKYLEIAERLKEYHAMYGRIKVWGNPKSIAEYKKLNGE